MHPQAEGRRALLLFLATVTTVALLVFAGGWFTGLRHVMHAALLAVAVVAFLPLVMVAAGFAVVAILFAGSLVFSALGDGAVDVSTDGGLIEGGARAAPGYYRFMAARFVARRKHPVFWGLPLGILLGGLALWGVLAAYVLPGEATTAETRASRTSTGSGAVTPPPTRTATSATSRWGTRAPVLAWCSTGSDARSSIARPVIGKWRRTASAPTAMTANRAGTMTCVGPELRSWAAWPR